jgi:hypothetical protein
LNRTLSIVLGCLLPVAIVTLSLQLLEVTSDDLLTSTSQTFEANEGDCEQKIRKSFEVVVEFEEDLEGKVRSFHK